MPPQHSQPTVGRNDPCPCGSGKKFKKCCINKVARPVPAPRPAAPSPAQIDAWLAEGMAAHRAAQMHTAAAAYARVLDAIPGEPRATFGLARLAAAAQNYPEAIRLNLAALAADSANVMYRLSLGDLYYSTNQPAEALRAAQQVLEREPGNQLARYMAAMSLEQLRRLDDAVHHAEQAVKYAPDDHRAVITLAHFRRVQKRHEEARDLLEPILQHDDLPPDQRLRALHELGMVRDALRDAPGAIDAFTEYGRLRKADPLVRQFDADLPFRRIGRYVSAIEAGPIPEFPAKNEQRRSPAFLVGFPRSGTTLTEQVLSAHPEVISTDEEPITAAMLRLGRERTGAADDASDTLLAGLTEEIALEMRRAYRAEADRVLGEVPADSLLLDKLPLNLIDLPAIHAVFPDSRVIVALRDPRDVCLSCLMQDFRPNNHMVNLLLLEDATRLYEAVMDQWLRLRAQGGRWWREVRYEDTVEDLESQAHALLDHLGLPWDDAVLAFHEQAKERAIRTPSFAAVAQPVHTAARFRWKAYREALLPHRERLDRFIEAFGYEAW